MVNEHNAPEADGDTSVTGKAPPVPQCADDTSKETFKDSVRVIEKVTSRHGNHKTITELYMLADLIQR